jgi:hypothetical protein
VCAPWPLSKGSKFSAFPSLKDARAPRTAAIPDSRNPVQRGGRRGVGVPPSGRCEVKTENIGRLRHGRAGLDEVWRTARDRVGHRPVRIVGALGGAGAGREKHGVAVGHGFPLREGRDPARTARERDGAAGGAAWRGGLVTTLAFFSPPGKADSAWPGGSSPR